MHPRSPAFEQALAAIPSIRVCSFDIFDTFLLRVCTTPVGVFERAWQLLIGAGGQLPSKEAFVEHRIQAEAKARREAAEAGPSSEVSIAQIYAQFPLRLFGFARQDVDRLIEAEFAAEKALCRVNPDMADLLAAMQAAGLSTGFISDTYWSSDRIAELLSACRPGLKWDFLFVSCDCRAGKAEGLFRHYLVRQGGDPQRALHIGDNERADIRGAERARIRAIHYPQEPLALRDLYHAEEFAFRSFCNQPHQSFRLDGGLRTMRRTAARFSSPPADGGVGQYVLAPVIAAFDRFLVDRIDRLKQDSGRRVAIGFLGRDGILSFNLWQRLHGDCAHYLEINRRVGLLAAADRPERLSDLFKAMPAVDANAIKAILKTDPARIDELFSRQPRGTMSGESFAAALPGLFQSDEFAAIGKRMRDQLLAYLRTSIPDFDACTDLVLVDLGYSGTVQKALRRAFDLAGLRIRLHGLYLLTLDDAFGDIPGSDSAEGFISDLVVTPHGKRAMLRNIAPLEQLCCAPHGSVHCYQDGRVLREHDPRPQLQIQVGQQVQSEAIECAARLDALAAHYRIDPHADLTASASWCAAVLARLLLMPAANELALMASAKHDINLGTQAMVPLVDPRSISDLAFTSGCNAAYAAKEQPMWLAGSLAHQAPLHGILYSLFGAGLLPTTLLADRKAGRLDVALVSGAQARPAAVSLYRSPAGTVRLRIPMSRSMAITAVAVPIGRVAAHGRLVRATIQSGPTVEAALVNPALDDILPDALTWLDVAREGARFRDANPDNSHLVVPLPPHQAAATVVTLEFEIDASAGTSPTINTSDESAAA